MKLKTILAISFVAALAFAPPVPRKKPRELAKAAGSTSNDFPTLATDEQRGLAKSASVEQASRALAPGGTRRLARRSTTAR